MRKVNTNAIGELSWSSPRGEFSGFGREISEALGRKPHSTDLRERHPFDVEIMRVPPGATPYPYHSHSAQWEFYHVISGNGIVRHADGTTPVGSGDAVDLVVYVVADNPISESNYYPDSGKWAVRSPEYRLVRSEALDCYDGEE